MENRLRRRRRTRLPVVWFLLPLLMAFEPCASLNQGADTHGALFDWGEGGASPCSWFRVECSGDGRVMALNMRNAASRKLLASKQKDSQKNKIDGSGTRALAPSVPNNSEELVITFPPTPFGKHPVRSHPQHPREARQPPTNPAPPPSPEPIPPPPVSSEQSGSQENSGMSHSTMYALIGAAIVLVVVAALLAAYFFYYHHRNTGTVVPLSATSSIQLLTTALEGVTLFRLSQLEEACEGFSNIIDSSQPGCTLYKGTLPSAAEIAVVSTSVAYAGGWSATAEAHFKNKVKFLSMVNHKNLMNIVGYCEDEEPFTRIMVFEYVSNGSLFEHLHVKEAEHLNWQARLRIAMGVIYCLEYLHQQSPPVNLRNVNSSCIYLTEDNAAKVSDISFDNGKREGERELDASEDERSTVYKFALLLLETISGRRPYSDDDGLLVIWARRYLTGDHPVMDMVDPTLNSVPEEQVGALSELIVSCISEDPRLRPTIAEVTKRMQDITGITQDQATPRKSALWWAELEINTQ